MPNLIVLVGLRFGRLLVLSRTTDRKRGVARWICRCDCGVEIEAESGPLKNGYVKSCGCWASDRAKAGLNRKHGHSGTPVYNIWSKMKARCNNPNVKSYKSYGARGIKVCARWESFECFLEDMGERPSPQHSIDRIDNNKGYEPNNCRWVGSVREQRQNCRDNRNISFDGRTQTISAWAREYGILPETLTFRINAGWDIGQALTRRAWNQKTITLYGVTLTVPEWSRQTGISRSTISDRLAKGWPAEQILARV